MVKFPPQSVGAGFLEIGERTIGIPCKLKLETINDVLMSNIHVFEHLQKKEDGSESLTQPSKKIMLEDKENSDSVNMKSKDLFPKVWHSAVTLHIQDKETLLEGSRFMTCTFFWECLLKQQFPDLQSLSCTLHSLS